MTKLGVVMANYVVAPAGVAVWSCRTEKGKCISVIRRIAAFAYKRTYFTMLQPIPGAAFLIANC